ncbi:MAG: PhoH family protein [Rhodospirillales bacterium]|nr:PhoH family protein [Rhodospirillales bacterium]MBT4038508.1 PhoH family protein [Rhodospirillales bacterium]MBT4625420.1 PhoH family protein [Rhodospirillales bacterium]MBT5352058.1 PhoH family protein [Rhodospirillales bacterium]MBT5521827.1 PhoH family protein [Rhodospirillales bacterium]
MKGSASRTGHGDVKQVSIEMQFDDNKYVQELFGFHHSNLTRLEQLLDISIHSRGNELTVSGDEASIQDARDVLGELYGRLKRGLEVSRDEVDAAVRMATDQSGKVEDTQLTVHTRNKSISPRSANQAEYLRAIDTHDLVFGQGPAGTGKTYLAVAKAVELLVKGSVDRIILSRPAVEAGEQLGFLPGDMQEKVDPYLRPLYDALYDMLPDAQVVKRLESGEIEVAPLAFMRGRTLSNAFVILDEAQNTTAVQMKMFLTRLGENARMVITGDLSQVDLPRGIRSGLRDALETLGGVEGVAFVEFTSSDVVRHPLVSRIVKAYDSVENDRKASAPYEHVKAGETKSGKT